MFGSEREASASHLLVVLEVWAAALPATVFDVVGKETAEPERIVAQMRLDEKAAARVRVVEVLTKVHDGVVDLVVHWRDAARAVAEAKVDDDGRHVVRESAIVLTCSPQSVTDHH